MIEFTVFGHPVAKGRPKFSKKGFAYTPSKTRVAEESFMAQAIKYRPKEPLQGPISLHLVFTILRPKSKKNALHCVTRPDLDNYIKLSCDCMNGIFFKDDNQIVALTALKLYGDTPSTKVYINELL